MSRRWAWGSADCACSAWAVFARWHGYDPAPPFAYRTRAEADALIAGDFAGLLGRLAARSGLRPSGGNAWDIGTDGRTLVVCTGPQWIGKTHHGFGAIRGPILQAWR